MLFQTQMYFFVSDHMQQWWKIANRVYVYISTITINFPWIFSLDITIWQIEYIQIFYLLVFAFCICKYF